MLPYRAQYCWYHRGQGSLNTHKIFNFFQKRVTQTMSRMYKFMKLFAVTASQYQATRQSSGLNI